MSLSLMQQKQLQKQELQRECRRIEAVLKEIMPHHNFDDLSMNNDTQFIVRCDHVYAIAIGAKEMEPYGITQVKLIHFQTLIFSFTILLEEIKKKTNELYGE